MSCSIVLWRWDSRFGRVISRALGLEPQSIMWEMRSIVYVDDCVASMNPSLLGNIQPFTPAWTRDSKCRSLNSSSCCSSICPVHICYSLSVSKTLTQRSLDDTICGHAPRTPKHGTWYFLPVPEYCIQRNLQLELDL
jgi:hypothetical protein